MLENKSVPRWLHGIQAAEYLLNATAALTATDQFRAGLKMVQNSLMGIHVKKVYPMSQLWTSVFSGITVIANRMTPPHRDRASRPGWYDLLVSCGTDTDCYLDIADLGAKIRYCPGDACLIAGSSLQHAVHSWEGGDRLVFAHYSRFLVAERMGVNPGNPPFLNDYAKHFNSGFLTRNSHKF